MLHMRLTAAVVVALLCGAAWDLSGVPALAFVPLAVCALTLVAIAVAMSRIGELRFGRRTQIRQ